MTGVALFSICLSQVLLCSFLFLHYKMPACNYRFLKPWVKWAIFPSLVLSHYEILTLKIILKIYENYPRQRNWVMLKIFQRYFSAFSVLSLLPIMNTEIHLNHPKWFFDLHCKTAQYFFSVISSLSVWLAMCKDQYLNNKDKFSLWFSMFFQCIFLLYEKFQCNFIDFQCYFLVSWPQCVSPWNNSLVNLYELRTAPQPKLSMFCALS